MKPTRRLTEQEQALWRKLVETVTPLERRKPRAMAPSPTPPLSPPPPQPAPAAGPGVPKLDPAAFAQALARPGAPPRPAPALPARPREERTGLDASWERRIGKGELAPDFSLDLHGATLDQAYVRLMHGLAQARAMGARVVLVVTGRPRPAEAADRGHARGAIRAKIVDWLGASEHAGSIAAIRGAHRRHGGAGALYVVLRRQR